MLDRVAGKPVPEAKRAPRARVKEIDLRIGRRLREARQAAGITQAVLGAALGVTFQQVQKYERGTNCLSPGQLEVIAELLHRPVGWFHQARESEAADWVVRAGGMFLREGGLTEHIDEAGRHTSARAIAEADRYEDGEACPASDFAGDRWRSRASLIAELEVLRAAGEGAAHG